MKSTKVIIFFLLISLQLFSYINVISQTEEANIHFEFSEPFPVHLHCEDVIAPYNGATWQSIEIGSSTIGDLQSLIKSFHPSYLKTTFNSGQFVEFTIPYQTSITFEIPARISACSDPETKVITVLSFSDGFDTDISDLVIEYGEPDVVTWDFSPETRIAFWFEEGIAATIRVDESEQFEPYGTVLSMTCFPYQSAEGFEERWPYNRTVAGEMFEELELVATLELRATWTPDVPNVANPFDFEAMIATITAEPSRTPTATFTPVATESP